MVKKDPKKNPALNPLVTDYDFDVASDSLAIGQNVAMSAGY